VIVISAREGEAPGRGHRGPFQARIGRRNYFPETCGQAPDFIHLPHAKNRYEGKEQEKIHA
jgi:hypothetical protein